MKKNKKQRNKLLLYINIKQFTRIFDKNEKSNIAIKFKNLGRE